MTYQIVYYGPQGHGQKLAHALQARLPGGVSTEPLTRETEPLADIQLVGAELRFRDLDHLPELVAQYLRRLSGKKVLFFLTLPFVPEEDQRSRIHRSISRTLPADCLYQGLFLCKGEAEGDLIAGFRHAMEQKPKSLRIRHWLARCEQTKGHPNERDCRELQTFAAHILELPSGSMCSAGGKL